MALPWQVFGVARKFGPESWNGGPVRRVRLHLGVRSSSCLQQRPWLQHTLSQSVRCPPRWNERSKQLVAVVEASLNFVHQGVDAPVCRFLHVWVCVSVHVMAWSPPSGCIYPNVQSVSRTTDWNIATMTMPPSRFSWVHCVSKTDCNVTSVLTALKPLVQDPRPKPPCILKHISSQWGSSRRITKVQQSMSRMDVMNPGSRSMANICTARRKNTVRTWSRGGTGLPMPDKFPWDTMGTYCWSSMVPFSILCVQDGRAFRISC